MGNETTKTLTDLQRVRRGQRAHLPADPGEEASGDNEGLQGMVLGRYVVLYRVGSGGMGVVFAAYDPELDRKVAVKVLKRRGARSGDADLARQEAQAMARLTHPNVVTVHDVGYHDDELFIAMEFIGGRTLKDWLAEDEPPWQRVVERFVDAGRGLAAAHHAGLVHRDFKPSNVMLSEEGEVKVLDFGLAEYQTQREDSESSGIVTTRRRLVGTLAYLPPERLQGEDSDARSDQFSFCAALWQALYGVLPFPVDEPKQYLRHIEQGQPQEAPGRSIPGWLRQALQRGLSLDPRLRFPNLEELLRTISPGQRQRRRRRQGTLAASLGVLVVLTLFLWRQGPPPVPCGPYEDHLQSVWDGPRKAEIHRAFLATGVTFAEPAWQNTERILDSYTEGWLDQRIEACEATHVRQEQSESLLDQRMACLDQHFEQFRALSEALAEANASTVIDAVRAAGALESLAECQDRTQLSLLTPLPRDPALRQSIEGIRATVEGQLARQRFHRVPDLEALRRAVDAAAAVEYPPIHARALYALGWIEGQIGDRAAGVRHLVKAAQTALIASDPNQEVKAYAALVKLESAPPSNAEQAEMWLDFANSKLQTLGPGHDELQFEVADAAGWLANARNAPDQAEHWHRALELAERTWGPDSPRVASVLANLSLLSSVDGEIYLRRAIHLIESWYGVEHPALAQPLSNLAAFEAGLGRYEEAVALAQRSLDVIAAEGQDETPKRAYPLTLLAQLNNAMDQPRLARRHLAEATNSLTQGKGGIDDLRLRISLVATESDLMLLDLDAAEASLRTSEALIEQGQGQIPATDRLQSRAQRARLLMLRGRAADAWDIHRHVLDAFETTPLADEQRAEWWVAGAEILLARGDAQRAYPLTREALLLTDSAREPRRAARGHFAAARCLAAADPVAARLRAEQALELLVGEQVPRRRLRQEIDRWLREAVPLPS